MPLRSTASPECVMKTVFSNLVTADIIVALVDTAAIWSSPQRLSYRLDVWEGALTYD